MAKGCPKQPEKNVVQLLESAFIINSERHHQTGASIETPKKATSVFTPKNCHPRSNFRKLSRQAWDAIWMLTAVVARNSSLLKSQTEIQYSNNEQKIILVPDRLKSWSLETNRSSLDLYLNCLSGPLILEDGIRRPMFRIFQVQNGSMIPTMVYQPLRDSLNPAKCQICRPVLWEKNRPLNDAIQEHIE